MEVLRRGDSGALVDMLQLALIRAGHRLEIDSGFGAATEAVVRSFQSDNNLSVDGVVGNHTWAALRRWIAGYVTHQIVPGDTFWSLARRFDTTVEAIQIANPGLLEQSLQVAALATIPLGFPLVPLNVRYSSSLNELIIDGMVKRYPFMSSGVVGASLLGREIGYLQIGQGEKTVCYNASHHANEWVTTPILLKYAEDYATAIATGGTVYGRSARWLSDNTTLYIVPMVNPDGVDLVGGVINSGAAYEYTRMVASGYPDIPFPDGWKANIRGTDLNLNYPARWEQARDIKYAAGFHRPAPQDFVGAAPLSEPESAALAAFTQRLDFSLILAYHTQGEVIYWKFADYNPEGSYEIALEMSNSSGYAVETTPEYSANAGYKDWFIQDFNRPGYTIEAGLGVNPLPVSDIPDMYLRNIGIMTIGMDTMV